MYAFLQGLTLKDTGRQRKPKENSPLGFTLRIFANGEVYPSKELVTKFNLEYTNKNNENKGYGIDVIDSVDWTPTANLPRMILLGITPKTEAKVDLFATCRYDTETGNPKSTVITQGSTSETLLNLVRSMGYLTEDQKYCDLELVLEHPITMEDGIANIPKLIEKGDRKGEKTYERRENVTFYAVNTVENLAEMKTSPVATPEATTTVETN